MRFALAPWRAKNRLAPLNDPFVELQNQFNQLFEGLWDDGKTASRNWLGVPKTDISETEQELHVTAELPGMKEEDIDVEFKGDVLWIRGEKKDEREEQEHNFHRVERSFGKFERAIPIPVEVDREKVQATFKNGVLNITLPKAVTAPASHKIEVKPGT